LNIYIKSNRYILEDFGALEISKKAEILQCFLGDEDKLLFEYYCGNLGDLYPEMIEEQKEDCVNSFCQGTMSFNNENVKKETEEKIKDLLLSAQDSGTVNNYYLKEIDTLKQELFVDFCKGRLNSLCTNVNSKIKDIIYLSTINDMDKNIVSFINERKIFINSEWVSFRQKPDRWDIASKIEPQLIWYSVKEKDEIIKAIGINMYSFNCVVIRKNCMFKDYAYALISYEGIDTLDLAVLENQSRNFEEVVVPRIKKQISNVTLTNCD